MATRPSSRIEKDHAYQGGAEPTGEPRSQDTARGGRGIGLGFTTILGIALIAVPLVWAAIYLAQAGIAGLGSGFVLLMAVVLLGCIAAGVLLVRGLFRT
jgi:hypothetical protein